MTIASPPFRILVAEDHAPMRALLARRLRDQHFEVLTADDGDELMQWLDSAIAHADSAPLFDAVVTDHRLPGRTGLQALQHAHAHGYLVPTILITAFGDTELHRQATLHGAFAVLDKPFAFAELCALLRAAL